MHMFRAQSRPVRQIMITNHNQLSLSFSLPYTCWNALPLLISVRGWRSKLGTSVNIPLSNKQDENVSPARVKFFCIFEKTTILYFASMKMCSQYQRSQKENIILCPEILMCVREQYPPLTYLAHCLHTPVMLRLQTLVISSSYRLLINSEKPITVSQTQKHEKHLHPIKHTTLHVFKKNLSNELREVFPDTPDFFFISKCPLVEWFSQIAQLLKMTKGHFGGNKEKQLPKV